MLAATLVSLSAGALVAPAAGTPTNRVIPSLVQLGIEPGSGLKEEDLGALLGQLLRDDRTAAAGADDDGVRARVHR